MDAVGVVAKQNEHWGAGPGLCSVKKLEPAVADYRRLMCADSFLERPVEDAGCNSAVVLPENLAYRREYFLRACTGEGRKSQDRGEGHEAETPLQIFQKILAGFGV